MQEKEKKAVQLKNLKEEFFRMKEEIDSIKELVKAEIDGDYHVDPWELSPRELDNQMGGSLSFLNDDIDTRPDPAAITSHRKILGKPIVFVKRVIMKLAAAYTNSILEKQRRFNDRLVAFHLASFVRFKQNEKKLHEIEERLKDFEDNQELMLDELRNIQESDK
jgi:hypothetical protein